MKQNLQWARNGEEKTKMLAQKCLCLTTLFPDDLIERQLANISANVPQAKIVTQK